MSLKRIDNTVKDSQEFVDRVNSVMDKCEENSNVVNFLKENINNWYGVEWDVNVADPDCMRIGSEYLHKTLPIQSGMRRCVVNNKREVVYYLDAVDSCKKENGVDVLLDGQDGDVMVEVPEHWRLYEEEGSKRRMKISNIAIPGYIHIPKFFMGAFQSVLDREANSLHSFCNNDLKYRGGNNNPELDDGLKSLLGCPVSYISRTDARIAAISRGAGWTLQLPIHYYSICWLFYIEYATFNSQKNINSTLTDGGFKTGGLGSGLTTVSWDKWAAFNGNYPLVKNGITSILGNKTGEVSFTLTDFDGIGLDKSVKINSYRGLENVFGHIYTWLDGINLNDSVVYINNKIESLKDDTVENYVLAGQASKEAGWQKQIIAGIYGITLPVEVGGNSSTYMCDYFYINPGWRAVLVGGSSHAGSNAGLACSSANAGASGCHTNVGVRLCAFAK